VSQVDFDDVRIGGRRALQAKPSMASLAREDPALFAQYVLRDERTGKPIRLAPMHVVWHDLLSKHDRLVIWSHVEAGKTTQVSIARVLWEIGRNPSLRVLVLSNTHSQAAKIVRAIANYIEESAALHEVFPELVPTTRNSEPWAPGRAVTVSRPNLSKDPTVTASGVHGNVMGARFDLVVLDDVLDWENTRTADARKELVSWLQATVAGRLTHFGRMVVVGTAFHPEDALHHYARTFSAKEQRAFKYPVVDEYGNPRWPEAWPAKRIEERRQEVLPGEFARQMLCESRDDAEARFKREWIDIALQRGREKDLCFALRTVPRGCMTFTGVDLAVQQHASADLTVLFTIIVHPNQDREVLDIQAGRWVGPDIVQRIIDTHHRYQSIVMVENNAAQEFILQFARHMSAVPVRPYTTGRSKAHPEFGVESLATEMMNGKWIVPNRAGIASEVQAWVQEMLYYDPKAHTGDRLMACFLAREAARQGVPKAQVGRLDLMSR
jgi:hypothetical protein